MLSYPHAAARKMPRTSSASATSWAIREESPPSFVDQWFGERNIEHHVRQFDLAKFFAGQVQNLGCWHSGTSVLENKRLRFVYYFLPCRAAFLTTTTLPFAPGTAPLIINKLFSASTRATVSLLMVTRTSPMCPDE